MNIYTIFDRPDDFPNKIVVRRFWVGPGMVEPKEVIALVNTLEEARESIPPGLALIPRELDDDLNLIESWL